MFGGAACLQHYVVRAFLAWARVAPWAYGRFLEAMKNRYLLARIGSAYQFFQDPQLRLYFAALSNSERPPVLNEQAVPP
jgi:hypothetical protein